MLRLLTPLILLALAILSGCREPPPAGEAASDRAMALAGEYLIVDTHIDVPYRLHKRHADVSRATEDGDFDYPRAVAGGLDAVFMSIYIPAEVDAAGEAHAFAEGLIDSVEALTADAAEQFSLATCADDVTAIKASGRIAMALGMENGGPIGGDLDNLAHFASRGIRYVTLAHSKSNHISDSSYDLNERWQGLSEFGKALIPEMNRRGIMVDVSHLSDKAFWQVLGLTATPVIASHSSLRHFTPGFQRNMTDEMVTALGENGGVVQINFGSRFLTKAASDYSIASQQALLKFRAEEHASNDEARLQSFTEQYRLDNPYPYATVDDVLDHIDRAVALAGIDHVGLGSDYDGVGDSLPVGLKDVSAYPNLVDGMLGRGYSETDIGKMLGANLMRVWSEAEDYAEEAGQAPRCTQAGRVGPA